MMSSSLLETPAWQRENLAQESQRLSAGHSASVQAQRQHHLARFLSLPWPSRQDEAWRYLKLARWVKQEYNLIRDTADIELALEASDDFYDVVFLNGVLQDNVGLACNLPAGVTVTRLPLLIQDKADKERIDPITQDEKIFHLNQALSGEGLEFRIKQGVQVDKPIRLLNFIAGDESPSMFHTQYRVVVEKGASLSLIDVTRSLDSHQVFMTNTAVLQQEYDSSLHYLKIKDINDSSWVSLRTLSFQEQESSLDGFSLMRGGAILRDQLTASLLGKQSQFDWSGLLVSSRQQNIALFCDVRHLTQRAHSQQTLRAVARDQSQIVINGHIYVDEGASLTEAHLQNKNLLLSDTAKINTKPQLVIYNDDVQCSHGATVGQLNEDALFYLQSRGMNQAQAREMLESAFVLDLIEAYPDGLLQDCLIHELGIEGLLHE